MSPRLATALAFVAALLVAGCGEAMPAPGGRPPARRAPTSPRPAGRRGQAGPPAPAVTAALVAHGPRRRRWVALTFDADMTEAMRARLRTGRQRSWIDGPLFAELRATRTPATIFLTGLWTAQYPRFVRRLAADPRFELENHTLDHAAWRAPCYGLATVDTDAARRAELVRARSIIERTAGVVPHYLRFPGGCHGPSDLRLVARQHEQALGWDVVSGDAFQPAPGPIVRAVLAGVRPGSIVVGHCVGAPNAPATAAAMRVLIPALRARGYRFVTLRRLLSER